MRTAFICFYEAYPPVSGAAAVTYGCATYAGGDRVLIQLGAEDSERTTAEGVRVITVAGATDVRWRKIAGLGPRIGSMAARCRAAAPDRVVLEGASWAPYHALLAMRLRRDGIAAPIVYHAHNVEYCLRREKHGAAVTWLTRRAEGWLLRRCDYAFAVSSEDAAIFERLYGIRPGILPNAVDWARFASVSDADVERTRAKYGLGGAAVLFMGLYLYRPNREAVDFLVKSVFPLVRERCPEATLAVLGQGIPYSGEWLVTPGSIPHAEVPAFATACRAGVAPVFSGSGTRLKILEYMAAGLPVVASGKGAEGLEMAAGEEYLAAETAGEFAGQIVRLLREPDLAAVVAGRGRARVKERYDWPAVMAEFNAAVAAGECRAAR
jgi:glycosyltransferase involved in cell wall biosynthesis